MRLAGIIALAICTTPAIAQDAKPPITPEAQERAVNPAAVIMTPDQDPVLMAAAAEARRHLPDFVRHFTDQGGDERGFMLKFDILPGARDEYIWATNLQRDGNGWSGLLLDAPVLVGGFKAGQRVPIPAADIVDWAYIKGRVMQGAFTERALLDRLPPEVAAQRRASFGW